MSFLTFLWRKFPQRSGGVTIQWGRSIQGMWLQCWTRSEVVGIPRIKSNQNKKNIIILSNCIQTIDVLKRIFIIIEENQQLLVAVDPQIASLKRQPGRTPKCRHSVSLNFSCRHFLVPVDIPVHIHNFANFCTSCRPWTSYSCGSSSWRLFLSLDPFWGCYLPTRFASHSSDINRRKWPTWPVDFSELGHS